MELRTALRLGALAGLVVLAGCAAPGTTVRYGEVLADPTIYSGGTGVYSSPGAATPYPQAGVYYDPETGVYYEDEPTVVYEDPAVVVRPPTVVRPAPIYVEPSWYPWYPGYPYGPGFGGYYRGHRVAPPPRHHHHAHPDRPRHRPDGHRGHEGRPGVRPPQSGDAPPHARPGARPPAPFEGIRGGTMRPPPSSGYGRRESGENSGP